METKATTRNQRGLFLLCCARPRRLRCCLLLIGRDERIGYEGFELRRRCVAGGARFQGAHVSCVEGGGHLQDQVGEFSDIPIWTIAART
jgi:hypothetical protein